MSEVSEQFEIIESWVEALRSGEYPCIKKLLRDDDGFDAFGVLLDLHDPSGWEKADSYHLYVYNRSNWFNNIPTELADLYNINDNSIAIIILLMDSDDPSQIGTLYGVDFAKYVGYEPFERVAKYVEEYIL